MKKNPFKSQQINDFMNHEFDFSNQHKDTYDDWNKAFIRALIRNCEDGCFIGLSSGYDSGVMAHLMDNLGYKFKTYTITGAENQNIINQRLNNLKVFGNCESAVSNLTQNKFDELKSFLKDKIINDKYIIRYNGVETDMRILDDDASMGSAFMCELASKEGRKVYISTQGSDEIMSDYSLIPMQSELKGIYPRDLKEWWNFKNGCNYSYLLKEERVPAVYGIETRYPFLDIDVVQEFLWLKPELKNAHYKAPLYEYLKTNKVPFEENVKRGFSIKTV
jgi:asparagine synthetase B (glutamine-hydrolysing)